jgi:O-antigen/teichoic acid export membrane protein
MKKNISSADRIIRLLIAIALVILYFTKTIAGTWGIVGMVVAAILLLTVLINFCPLYGIFGISTCKVKKTA